MSIFPNALLNDTSELKWKSFVIGCVIQLEDACDDLSLDTISLMLIGRD